MAQIVIDLMGDGMLVESTNLSQGTEVGEAAALREELKQKFLQELLRRAPQPQLNPVIP